MWDMYRLSIAGKFSICASYHREFSNPDKECLASYRLPERSRPGWIPIHESSVCCCLWEFSLHLIITNKSISNHKSLEASHTWILMLLFLTHDHLGTSLCCVQESNWNEVELETQRTFSILYFLPFPEDISSLVSLFSSQQWVHVCLNWWLGGKWQRASYVFGLL